MLQNLQICLQAELLAPGQLVVLEVHHQQGVQLLGVLQQGVHQQGVHQQGLLLKGVLLQEALLQVLLESPIIDNSDKRTVITRTTIGKDL